MRLGRRTRLGATAPADTAQRFCANPPRRPLGQGGTSRRVGRCSHHLRRHLGTEVPLQAPPDTQRGLRLPAERGLAHQRFEAPERLGLLGGAPGDEPGAVAEAPELERQGAHEGAGQAFDELDGEPGEVGAGGEEEEPRGASAHDLAHVGEGALVELGEQARERGAGVLGGEPRGGVVVDPGAAREVVEGGGAGEQREGYGATLAELWDQCRRQGVALPQPCPVSPSAMCAARAKVHENLFRALHAELLRRAGETAMGPRWKGHRLFAVDGTKLNLPRPLVAAGYRTPSDNAHYPQGLLSCLYRLRSRIPVDFDLVAHADERKAALSHLDALADNDVVVYDRGYFSRALLCAHIARGLHPVFRLQANANAVAAAFVNSDDADRVVEISAGAGREGGRAKTPLRLVKYEIAGSAYVLGTTLLDRRMYPRRRPVGPLPRALGRRGTVQGVEATDRH